MNWGLPWGVEHPPAHLVGLPAYLAAYPKFYHLDRLEFALQDSIQPAKPQTCRVEAMARAFHCPCSCWSFTAGHRASPISSMQVLAKEDLPVDELHGDGRSNVKHGAVQAWVPYLWLSGSRPAPGHVACIMDEVANTDGCIMLLHVKARVIPGMGNMKKQARMLQDVF